jgi:sugar phosphate isomerase/epimerase
MAPIYRRIAALPGQEPILEIPVPGTEAGENVVDALRQYAVLYHGKPRLDGVSGFATPRYREFRRVIQSFPDPDALAAARLLGARWIVVHFGDYTPPRRADLARRVASERLLEPTAQEQADVLYRLGP